MIWCGNYGSGDIPGGWWVLHGQRCRIHFGEIGGVSVEVFTMVINMPPLSGHGDKGLRVCLIWCGSGDIAGGLWGFSWTEVQNSLW